jgi:glucose/arabinose dehydrogenase
LHEENGFIEPIYAFIPSIGISQIVKIDDNFSKNWDNNFLIASLNGNHLYRIKFDKEFEKVFFIEEIYIGERIRDLIFLKEENVILLALESSGSLGILKK